MNNSIKDRREDINLRKSAARKELQGVEGKQKALESELSNLQAERQKYFLLSEISDRLDQLQKQGGAELFWGDGYDRDSASQHAQRIRDMVVNFDARVSDLQDQYNAGQENVRTLSESVYVLDEESSDLDDYAEEVKNEFVVEREMAEAPFRPMVMPWSYQGEDERRFRRIVARCLAVALLLGFLIPLWDIPIPDRIEPVVIPERLAQLIAEKKPPPPPPTLEVEKRLEETPKEKRPKKVAPKPTTKKAKVARKKIESAGLMAFKNNFSELINSGPEKKLGAQARISSLGKTARKASRSLLTAQATGGSGGISTASLSRDVGGAGKGIKGVGFERVESAIGSDFFGEERPLSGGPGPSRTDEEIQIVFDRYKAALYRIYNRELRKNPTLQGKIVLRMTIQPNGKVSSCKMDSSDLDSPALESKIVARVLKFNFGPKDDVPPVTILYPIDFLPSS